MSKGQTSIPNYFRFYFDHFNGIAIEIIDSSRNFLLGDIQKVSGYKKDELNNDSSGTRELLINPVSGYIYIFNVYLIRVWNFYPRYGKLSCVGDVGY